MKTVQKPLLDRSFLHQVAQATAANPFTDQRAQLDAQLLGRAWDPHADWKPADAVALVQDRMRGLIAAGGSIRALRGADRELLRAGLMFHLFHSVISEMDRHIAEQRISAEPLPVPFAAACLGQMDALGFEREEALRCFAAFFQLRRAFYFLHRDLAGRGAAMKLLRARLWNNLFTHDFLQYERVLWNHLEDFSVLLLGETGVGKGTAAAALGRSAFIPFDPRSNRFAESFTETFVAANLSQFSEALIESELFGHCRGAFTGAIANHQGLLARCKPNGAIFLDEVGDLSPQVQLKLLRVLQERLFSPVGSHEPQRFAGRVVAATNRSLADLRRGGFRDDFYYRLCSDTIVVPTLRERLRDDPGEFGELVRHILKRLCGEGADALADDTARMLQRCLPRDYRWPGNVRELEQAVRSVLLNGRYTPAEAAGDAASEGAAGPLVAALSAGTLDARRLVAGYCRMLYESCGNYGEVARRTGLDRRTVRKHVLDETRKSGPMA